MKQIRMVVMAAVLMAGTAVAAHAQDTQPQRQRGGRMNMSQMLMKDITLSAEQQTKYDAISKKYQDESRKMREEMSGGDRQAMMGKMREMQTKQNDEIKAILTDEQKVTFDKNVADVQARRQRRTPPTF